MSPIWSGGFINETWDCLPENGVYRGQNNDNSQCTDCKTGREIESLASNTVSPATTGMALAVGVQDYPDESEQSAEHIDSVEMVAGPALAEKNPSENTERRQCQKHP